MARASNAASVTGSRGGESSTTVTSVSGQAADQRGHSGRPNELTGVGRKRPRREHPKGQVFLPRLQRVIEWEITEQHGGEPNTRGHREHVGDRRAAKVCIDQHDVLACLSKRDGQVDGGRGLALAGDGTGDDQAGHAVIDRQEANVGAQLPERLGAWRERIMGDQPMLVRFRVVANDRENRRVRRSPGRPPCSSLSGRACRGARTARPRGRARPGGPSDQIELVRGEIGARGVTASRVGGDHHRRLA